MSSPTLTDKVSKMIYQDILSGELKPSQKLVVADLKSRYHVGASPIREALVQLSWTKYVSLEPQKGCWVSPVCVEELEDLYESLRTVAAVLLKKSIKSGGEDWELEVLTSFHKLSRINLTNDNFDWKEWEERQHQFHIALLEGSNSRNMFEFFTDLINQIKRYRYFARHNGLDPRQFEIDEYEKIMKLVLAKDTDEAAEEFDRHLHRSMEQIQITIEQAA
ncbi:XRE family transcriptional regulator [Vibrio coralliilyticus]|uniref:XRE family transcriptional regulator n=1 Tax=Vibrio coralliilyticus TaxID=190893 RepID=A0A097AV66_9VIBR|nr:MULTISPECIES: FCD domain-containing protein [Vibrio]MCM5509088.1 FCD domain-containing protein [Vibrio sp. SCSIO 43169]NOH63822.1 FCD domain-containing protein [Vibrio sp. RE88]AIS53785.1 XRE family transcriptional regulator [Vibrio coralliilyticus]AIW19951.1 XRE family transcriptional regulator [Vibrio coralliilyticus]ARC93158.1 GntR family transcriptional regulator [Vibrio coralliilyticus]